MRHIDDPDFFPAFDNRIDYNLRQKQYDVTQSIVNKTRTYSDMQTRNNVLIPIGKLICLSVYENYAYNDAPISSEVIAQWGKGL